MFNEFDELAKGLAQSATRRQALKRFGVGLAGVALACFGLANKAGAQTACLPDGYICQHSQDCCSGYCAVVNGKTWGGIHYKACSTRL